MPNLEEQRGDEVPIISLWFMITLSRIVQFFFKIKEVNKENTFVSVGGVFRGVLSIWIIGIILWIAIIWARIHRDMNSDSDMMDQQIYYMVWYDTGWWLKLQIFYVLNLKIPTLVLFFGDYVFLFAFQSQTTTLTQLF